MQPLRIESLSNPIVKGLRALRAPKGRDEQRLFLAEGERTIATATAAGWIPEMLLTAGPLRAPIDGGASHARESFSVTTEVLAKITGRDNPQEQLAVYADPAPEAQSVSTIDPSRAARWLMLEAGGVILVGNTCDPYSIETVRATMGSIFTVPIYRATHEEAVVLLKRWPGSTVATALDGASDYSELTYATPTVIVIGTEADGLSANLRGACASAALIPMLGTAESLNLAVASAIMLYAAERAQR
jgi:TrmH family RNA methyltransferase